MKILKSNNIKKTVTECFSSDPNYVQFHTASNEGLDKCIDITVSELSCVEKYTLFELIDNDDNIMGMFGVENSIILNPFFIKPQYRKKEYIGDVLNIVKSKLNKDWFIGLFSINAPAVNFFLKNEGKQVGKTMYKNHELIVLQFQNGSL